MSARLSGPFYYLSLGAALLVIYSALEFVLHPQQVIDTYGFPYIKVATDRAAGQSYLQISGSRALFFGLSGLTFAGLRDPQGVGIIQIAVLFFVIGDAFTVWQQGATFVRVLSQLVPGVINSTLAYFVLSGHGSGPEMTSSNLSGRLYLAALFTGLVPLYFGLRSIYDGQVFIEMLNFRRIQNPQDRAAGLAIFRTVGYRTVALGGTGLAFTLLNNRRGAGLMQAGEALFFGGDCLVAWRAGAAIGQCLPPIIPAIAVGTLAYLTLAGHKTDQKHKSLQ